MINAFLAAVNKHVIAESTNLTATYDGGAHIFNIKASANLDNGKLVNLDGMVAYNATTNPDEHEVFTMVEPTATSRVGLVLSVAVGPDESPKAATYEYNFYNGEGEIMRVYDLFKGDKFTVSANGIKPIDASTALAKGQLVLADGYDLAAAAANTNVSAKAFVGEIVEVINRANGVFYKILVRKNG